MPARCKRRSYEVDAEYFIGESTASLYRLAAWVLQNEGRAWVESNWEEGPDQLHIRTRNNVDVIVPPKSWVVCYEPTKFEVFDPETFENKFEPGRCNE